MCRNLSHLRTKRTSALYARTLPGRILSLSGTAFAIYCVFRIVCVRILSFSLLPFLIMVHTVNNQRPSVTVLARNINPNTKHTTANTHRPRPPQHLTRRPPILHLPRPHLPLPDKPRPRRRHHQYQFTHSTTQRR
jgi:Abscisic acid G-protein coupled receptor